MKGLKKAREADTFNQLYWDFLIDKAKTSKRRKAKFNHSVYTGKKTHWVNMTGEYKKDGNPKYWNGQKQVLNINKIRTYGELSNAIKSISHGEKNLNDYSGVSGINRARILLAQSWKDREIDYTVSDIISLSPEQMKKELGFGAPCCGKAYQTHSSFLNYI